jgi:putative sigma-54 modulation protein
MNIEIQSIHFDADKKLLNLINKKVGKLSRFFDNAIGNKVYLRIDKSSTTDNKVVEIKIQVPGNDLFVKRQCHTFEKAIDECVSALAQQLKKRKAKTRRSMARSEKPIHFIE